MTDDKKLKHIESEYGSGRMLTGEAKAELVKVMIATLVAHHVLLMHHMAEQWQVNTAWQVTSTARPSDLYILQSG